MVHDIERATLQHYLGKWEYLEDRVPEQSRKCGLRNCGGNVF